MDDTKISGEHQYQFMQKLNFVRAAGTEGERCAANKIKERLEELGLSPKIEEFSFWGSREKKCELEALEPIKKKYSIASYRNCGNTDEDGWIRPFIYVENGDVISLQNVKGKIVMINGPISVEKYQMIKEAGAEGFLGVFGGPFDPLPDRKPVEKCIRKEKLEEIEIPGGAIHYWDAVDLVTEGITRVRLQSKTEPYLFKSQNVVVRIEGTEHPEEIITLTAHYDSVPQGPGAYDNLAGAAIIYELCKYFSENPPKRTLEFIWFGSEEEGLKGSEAYVEKHQEELKNHLFNMNVDLAGQLIGGTVLGIAGGEEITKVFSKHLSSLGMGCSFKNQMWSSDSNTFAYKGIPAMTMNRDGYGMHTSQDTMDLISPWSLKRSACLLGNLAELLSENGIMWA